MSKTEFNLNELIRYYTEAVKDQAIAKTISYGLFELDITEDVDSEETHKSFVKYYEEELNKKLRELGQKEI